MWVPETVACVEIISGALLIWSVLKIRSFMKEREEDGAALNLKTLLLHSSTFALFALGVTINAVFYALEALA